MKKLLIALTAAASAFGLYADPVVGENIAIGGAGFDSVDAAPLTWTPGDGFAANWSGTDGTMTRTSSDCDRTAANRPAGYSVTDKDGYMALKTTLGTPVYQNVKASGEAQIIDPNFFYDGLVQFTAFDETPDMTAYSDAKIGIFPMLENPESETAYLWVYANGNPTNLWKTTKVIDGDWHRVTIKMIKNVTRTTGATDVGFVVFVDGEAVNADNQAAFDGLDLNPAALAYYKNGQLFRSLDPTANEFTGVAYDGQGLLDEVGFTDLEGAPDWALDENWKSLAWGSKIAEVYLWEQAEGALEPQKIDTLTGSPADFVAKSGSTYFYTYKAASTGYMDQTELVEIDGAQKTIADPKTCAAKVNGKGYETIDDALGFIADEATDDVELVLCAPVEKGIEIYSSYNVTLDLAGFDITAGEEDAEALMISTHVTITDTTEDPGVISGGSIATISSPSYDLTIEGGIIDGLVDEGQGAGAMLEYTLFKGGKVSVNENVTADGECTIPTESGYIAKNVEGFWTVVADTRFTVTVVAAAENSTIESIVVDGEAVAEPAADDYKAETSVVVTYAANYGYKFTDPAQAVQELNAEGSTTAPAVEALPIVAYIAAVPYFTLGAAIDAVDGETILLNDNYTMTADETKLFAKSATLDLNSKTLTVPAALRTKLASFEIADGATVTFENGTIDLGTEGASYGIAVLGTLNVNCTITRAGATGPVFDSYNGTINFGSDADVTGNFDVVRCKSLRDDEDELVAVTTTVTVADGAKLESGATIPMFYCYKTCTTLNATLNGGEFTAAKAVFGDQDKSGDGAEETWNVTIDAAKAKFANDKIEFGTAVDKIIPNQKPILNEGWYYLQDAIKVVEPVVGDGATLAGVAAGDKFAAGETVAFTVTADDEKVKVIDTVTVNDETLTAGEAGAYSWMVPEKLPESIEIVVTVKDPGSPIIDPTDPESKQTVEAEDADDAIAKAEVGVPEAAKGIVEPADYKAYFNFNATPAGDGKSFVVEITGLKAEVVEAPTTADLVANFDEIGEDGLTVVAKPGLFYGVKQAAAVDGVAAAAIETEGTGLATSTEVKLPVAKQGDAGFYKVVVDVKPFN